MAEVKWIKLDTRMFGNRKILQIEDMAEKDSIEIIWIKLLCLAGEINDSGLIYFTKNKPYTVESLATQLKRPLEKVQTALEVFEDYGMIEYIDKFLHITNWEKYQSADKLIEIREYNRLAKQKSRARQKVLGMDGNGKCH